MCCNEEIFGNTRTVQKRRTKNRNTVGASKEGAVEGMITVDITRMGTTKTKDKTAGATKEGAVTEMNAEDKSRMTITKALVKAKEW